MEDLCKKFPTLVEKIFANLDDQSLVKSLEANKDLTQIFDNQKFFWVRRLTKYNKNFVTFQDSWSKVLKKTPVENIKHLTEV